MSNDEHNLDWLDALQSDAEHFGMVINRVEALGVLAIEHIKQGNIKAALFKLAEMGEGIALCKKLVGVK